MTSTTASQAIAPQIPAEATLSAAELNAVRLGDRRTVLTPERLAQARKPATGKG